MIQWTWTSSVMQLKKANEQWATLTEAYSQIAWSDSSTLFSTIQTSLGSLSLIKSTMFLKGHWQAGMDSEETKKLSERSGNQILRELVKKHWYVLSEERKNKRRDYRCSQVSKQLSCQRRGGSWIQVNKPSAGKKKYIYHRNAVLREGI